MWWSEREVKRRNCKKVVRRYDFSYKINKKCNKTCNVQDGLPGCHSVKESACEYRRCKRWGFNAWAWKIPWIGNGNPLQCTYLENSIDREARWAVGHQATKSQTQLSNWTHTMYNIFNITNTALFYKWKLLRE